MSAATGNNNNTANIPPNKSMNNNVRRTSGSQPQDNRNMMRQGSQGSQGAWSQQVPVQGVPPQQGYAPTNTGGFTPSGYQNQYTGYPPAPAQPQQQGQMPANNSGTSLSKTTAGSSAAPPPQPYSQQQQQQQYMMYRGHPQQYQQYNPYYGRPNPVGMWQPNYPPPMYHPNPNQSGLHSNIPATSGAVQPRRKAPLNITTKDGKKLDFATPPSRSSSSSSKAGASMLAQAQSLLESKQTAKQARKAEEDKKKKEEEERLEKERKEKEEKERKEREERERLEKEEKERKEREEKLRLERERKEQEEKEKLEKELALERERKEKERLEEERIERERLEKERMEMERYEAEKQLPPKQRAFRPGGSLRPGGSRFAPRLGASSASSNTENISISRKVYSKSELLSYKDKPACFNKPADLPDFTIKLFSSGGGGGGGGHGNRNRGNKSDTWSRGVQQPAGAGGNNGNGRRQQSGGDQWNRGQPLKNRGNNRNQGNRRGFDPNVPVAPLPAPSENRWMPKKNTSALVVAEKEVKAILNKMTKEKFGKLSEKMISIEISSYEILTMMIHNVYEKAIDEPSYGDIYADLCVLLSKKTSSESFIHVIPTDEKGELTAYRWSNDVSASDSEVIGPFSSAQECIQTALDGEEVVPQERGDRKMTISDCRILENTFIKILSYEKEFYVVFMPLEKVKECGQQLSDGIFKTEEACMAYALKQTSFKRTLLNKCQDEFTKQDIYVDWKKEKKEFDKTKDTLSTDVREEKEEEFSFRRIKIKKQMLGNIKFIGELYKKGMIREHIMHFCIRSLLKLDVNNDNVIVDAEDTEMDEEDHEALCKLFTTIGLNLDYDKNVYIMNVYFTKMAKLSKDEELSSRSRFMYKDLIELRQNRWKSRREQETAKTLNEIRKDVAREERVSAQQQDHRSSVSGGKPYNNRPNYKGQDSNRKMSSPPYKSKVAPPKPQIGPDGWEVVGGGKSGKGYSNALPPLSSIRSSGPSKQSPAPPPPPPPPEPVKEAPPALEPLSKEKLELKAKNMRMEFIMDPSNVDDVLYSMDLILSTNTPDAGQKLIENNVDFAFECKDSERESVISLLKILYTKGKLTNSDFSNALSEMVEFIDSFEVDIPNACQYLGEILAVCLQIKALTKVWLIEKTQMLVDTYREKVMSKTEEALKSLGYNGIDSL